MEMNKVIWAVLACGILITSAYESEGTRAGDASDLGKGYFDVMEAPSAVVTGAQQAFETNFSDLKQHWMKVAIIANPTSVLHDLTHIVDAMLLAKNDSRVNIVAVLGPEHGFRGGAQAGHGGSATRSIHSSTCIGIPKLGVHTLVILIVYVVAY